MAGSRHSFAAYCLLAGAVLLLPVAGHALSFSSMETWNTGTTNWTCIDELQPPSSVPLSNPGGYLRVTFPAQSMSFPRVYRIQADRQASGGNFVGNYAATGSVRILFKLNCINDFPAQCRLYFCSRTNDNRWWFPLDIPLVGNWLQYDVSLNYYDGWTTDSLPTPEKFLADIKDIAWIGVRIQDNSEQSHSYALDEFVVTSPLLDSDSDGMNDYMEYLGGTDPHDPNSVFSIWIATPMNRVILTFNSVPGYAYEIGRSTNLVQGFQYLSIPSLIATNSTTTHEDTTTVGPGPYFYKVRIKP